MRDQYQTIVQFLSTNLRWLLGGILLTLFSSVGQTFFISSFAGEIREEFGLSHGSFGTVYMLATLASAITLVFAGRVTDELAVVKLAMILIILLAGAAVLMATAQSMMMLLLAIYLLRLLGQGMMTHTAMVAMGRWFVAERGRAVSITTTGHQLGECVLPVLLLTLLTMSHWRTAWLVSAGVLLSVALPLSYFLLKTPRSPSGRDGDNLERGRQWTRAEVLRDAPFWAVCTGVLAPAFIGTTVFFHQAYLGELKGWTPSVIARSFAVMSITSVCVGLWMGLLIDRYSARLLLPFFLLPLTVGCLVLAQGTHAMTMSVFMFLLGCSYGVSSAVFGAIWPEIYGTRHLGAIRSMVSAAMVFASALGPGLTGWLIDRGVALDQQLLVMSLYCLATMMVLAPVSRVLRAR